MVKASPKINAGTVVIKLKENIFDNLGKLKPYSEEDWQETWVEISDLPPEDKDDDVPF